MADLTRGGMGPPWRGDGQELVYSTDTHLLSVDVETSEGGLVSIPRDLFELPETVRPNYFDLSTDGQRTIWAEESEADTTTFGVVVNWKPGIE